MSLSPDQLLCWHGLASFYEKSPGHKESAEDRGKRVEPYRNMIRLYEKDDAAKDKMWDVYEKLWTLQVRKKQEIHRESVFYYC